MPPLLVEYCCADEQLETLGAKMARVEILLQSIDGRLRRIADSASCVDGGVGDLTVKLTELQQLVDPIEEIARD